MAESTGQNTTNPLAAAVAQGGGAYLTAMQQQNQAITQALTGAGLSQGQAQGLGSSTNPLIQGIVGAEAPSIAQYGQAFNAAEAGIGGLPASLGLQGAELQQTTALQGQQLQNQLAGNQISSQGIAEQLGIQGEQYGLQQQLAGIQQGQLTYNEGLQQSQTQVQGAATGTLGTQGYGQKQGQIAEQYQVGSAELANQLAGEGVTYKGEQLSAGNQQAQLANTAAGLGISQQQLQAQLAQGMTQIGIQGQQTQDQLFSQAAQAQAGEGQGLGAIFSNIGALTGLGPQAFTSSLPNLYGG